MLGRALYELSASGRKRSDRSALIRPDCPSRQPFSP